MLGTQRRWHTHLTVAEQKRTNTKLVSVTHYHIAWNNEVLINFFIQSNSNVLYVLHLEHTLTHIYKSTSAVYFYK